MLIKTPQTIESPLLGSVVQVVMNTMSYLKTLDKKPVTRILVYGTFCFWFSSQVVFSKLGSVLHWRRKNRNPDCFLKILAMVLTRMVVRISPSWLDSCECSCAVPVKVISLPVFSLDRVEIVLVSNTTASGLLSCALGALAFQWGWSNSGICRLHLVFWNIWLKIPPGY